ncbi:hypothetical protein BDD12DRAFT_857287 [Trichophaea hybrida]|nr:hypothetical protein BDD12DRAFT_857287 [Trichophaea hybrida]
MNFLLLKWLCHGVESFDLFWLDILLFAIKIRSKDIYSDLLFTWSDRSWKSPKDRIIFERRGASYLQPLTSTHPSNTTDWRSCTQT